MFLRSGWLLRREISCDGQPFFWDGQASYYSVATINGWFTLHQWLIVVSSSAIVCSSRLRLAFGHARFYFVVFIFHWGWLLCSLLSLWAVLQSSDTNWTWKQQTSRHIIIAQFKYLPISNVTLLINNSFHNELSTDVSEIQKGNHRRPNIVNAGGCWKRHTIWFSVESAP